MWYGREAYHSPTTKRKKEKEDMKKKSNTQQTLALTGLYKSLKLFGGHVYDRSSVLDCHGSVNCY
jgi:hypothetical protein